MAYFPVNFDSEDVRIIQGEKPSSKIDDLFVEIEWKSQEDSGK